LTFDRIFIPYADTKAAPRQGGFGAFDATTTFSPL